MREQVLLFRFEDPARRSAVRKALLPLHIGCKVIPAEEWDKPLGAFVGLETTPQAEMEAAELTEEVLVLCGLTGQGIQTVVTALRKAGLYIPYKASLTPINKDWNVGQLFCEIYQEHQMMQAQKQSKHAQN